VALVRHSVVIEDDMTNAAALAQPTASVPPSPMAQTRLEQLQEPVIIGRIEAVSAEAAA
jgi:hypothetical protein